MLKVLKKLTKIIFNPLKKIISFLVNCFLRLIRFILRHFAWFLIIVLVLILLFSVLLPEFFGLPWFSFFSTKSKIAENTDSGVPTPTTIATTSPLATFTITRSATPSSTQVITSPPTLSVVPSLTISPIPTPSPTSNPTSSLTSSPTFNPNPSLTSSPTFSSISSSTSGLDSSSTSSPTMLPSTTSPDIGISGYSNSSEEYTNVQNNIPVTPAPTVHIPTIPTLAPTVEYDYVVDIDLNISIITNIIVSDSKNYTTQNINFSIIEDTLHIECDYAYVAFEILVEDLQFMQSLGIKNINVQNYISLNIESLVNCAQSFDVSRMHTHWKKENSNSKYVMGIVMEQDIWSILFNGVCNYDLRN